MVLVATIYGGNDQKPSDGPPVRLSSTAHPSPEVGGQGAPPTAPGPPLIEDHAGVWASVYYVLKTDPSPERDGIYRISHGSECELFHR